MIRKTKKTKLFARIKSKKRKTKITTVVKKSPVKKSKLDNVVKLEKVKKKRKPRTSNKIYFGQSTQDAIIQYNSLPDHDVEGRNRLYEEKIKFPFEKLVENIFNTFKFTYFETSPANVQEETVSHLVANMHRYDVSRGKAFSYFSIVAKHFLIYLNNSTYKRFNQHVDISEERDEHTVQLQSNDNHVKSAEMAEFIKLMVAYWEKNLSKVFTKGRDINIANAVIELFRNSDMIECFNKKALYLYIRDMSSCKTQQITKVINKMKQYQQYITDSYQNTGFVNSESLSSP